jgi:uncharacterized protein YyaL (SSP411 family)
MRLVAHVALLAVLLSGARAAPSPPSPAATFRFSPRPNRARDIHWRAFGPEAFAAARAAHRPLFLSLSAVWCHWCHVMDETTFSDARVIALINDRFIPLRVDADQHPDVERRYLLGGWPTVAVLTPSGAIIDGGTYLPPDRFLALADAAARTFAGGGRALAAQLARFHRGDDTPPPGGPDPALPAMLVESTVRALTTSADLQFGGFGADQKFPDAPAVRLLLAVGERALARQALDGILHLEDPIAGGFFRYAMQRDWTHPHYEKLLSTHAELLARFARAARLLDEPRYRDAAVRTARWLRATLFDERSGALWASQDADERYYTLDAAARAKSEAPFIDRTLLADRACLAIAALATAARDLDRPELARFARAATRALPSPLVHAPGVPAQLGDYAECALAALALDDAPRARALVAAAAPLHAPDGAYYDTVATAPLTTRRRPAVENARLALALLRLGERAHAQRLIAAVAAPIPEVALAVEESGAAPSGR